MLAPRLVAIVLLLAAWPASAERRFAVMRADVSGAKGLNGLEVLSIDSEIERAAFDWADPAWILVPQALPSLASSYAPPPPCREAVCQREQARQMNVERFIAPSVTGSRKRQITLRLIDAASGRTLKSQSIQATTDALIAKLDASVRNLLKSAGMAAKQRRPPPAPQSPPAVEPKVFTSRVVFAPDLRVEGDGIAAADMTQFLRSRVRVVAQCHEREIKVNPEVKGRVSLAFVVTPEGSVSSPTIVENTTQSGSLGSCLTNAVRTWRLPFHPPAEVKVTCPLDLRVEWTQR